MAELLGYTRLELTGWHFQKMLPPGGRIFYQTHVFPILKMHGGADEIYIALRTKNGVDIPMLMNAVRRERDGAAPVNDCVFVRMIQRHQYEDQLLQARRLAEQANEARARFLSMMSHDLRTPLTSITGHASLLAGGMYGPLTANQSDGVTRIRDAAQELLRMINDILNFAKLESGHVDMKVIPVAVRDAVARAESLVRVRLEEERLAFETTCDGGEVLADPDRLQQALLNLLTNAIKFTPAGGRITVSCARDGDRVLLRVHDTGIGIPPDQLQRVFEPFVQLDSTRADGVGLGLAISRELTRAMGGELTVESTPGDGATFTIALPAR